MGVGPHYAAEKRRRIETGIYHTPADPNWTPPEPKVKIVKEIVKLPNPDPNNYTILDAEQIGNYLIVIAQYPDCTNFEGKKIMVYKDTTPVDLLKQKELDPHFSDAKNYKAPFARFAPDDFGLDCARLLCKSLGDQKKTL